MEFWEYVRRVSAGASIDVLARAAGTTEAMIEGWATGARPSAVHVLRLAGAYHRPGLEALVAAGIMPADIADAARWPPSV